MGTLRLVSRATGIVYDDGGAFKEFLKNFAFGFVGIPSGGNK